MSDKEDELIATVNKIMVAMEYKEEYMKNEEFNVLVNLLKKLKQEK